MKHFISFALVAAAIIFTTGCSNGTKEASSVANDFLSAFFSTDYQGAAACCTEDLSKTLMESVEEYYNMEEETKDEVKDISSSIVTKITSAEPVDKETVFITYELTMPDVPQPVENHLTIKKLEDGWRVSEF